MKLSHVTALLAVAALSLLAGSSRAAEESADTLKSTIAAIVAAAQADQKDKVQELSKQLILADPNQFFAKIFGDEKGKKLADEYAKMPKDGIAELFLRCVKAGRTDVHVIKIDKADDPNATGLQKDALKAMKVPVSLYTVKLVEPGKSSGMSVWSFVFDDGAFRLAGKMRAIQ